MSNNIFRQKVLDELNSPEELDRMMWVLDSKMWMAMFMLLLGIAALITWSIFGSMPYKETAMGILIKGDGIMSVPSDSAGNVNDIYITVGDTVSRGQTIATVTRTDLLQNLRGAKRKLEFERKKFEQTVKFNKNILKKLSLLNKGKVQSLLVKKKSLKLDIDFLEKSLEKHMKLEADGLVTDRDIEQTRAKLRTARGNIEGLDVDIESVSSEMLKQEIKIDREEHIAKMGLKELEESMADAYAEYKRATSVLSTFSGKVVELRITEGDYIQNGSPVCTLEQADKKLSALLFVDTKVAKKLEQGMAAHISPGAVEKARFGSIISFVTSVGQYPVSQESLSNYLGKNIALAESLLTSQSVVAVTVDMLPDSTTHTGFKWSSSDGPDNVVVNAGTVCESTITVREDMPITLLLPFLKDLLAL